MYDAARATERILGPLKRFETIANYDGELPCLVGCFDRFTLCG